MDLVLDVLRTQERAAGQVRAREESITLRAKARRLRLAGPPYDNAILRTFASAATDFKRGLGYGSQDGLTGSGEDVSAEESVSFAILFLAEHSNKIRQYSLKYERDNMLALLRDIPERAPEHAAACEAVAAWEAHAREAAERHAEEEERRQAQAAAGLLARQAQTEADRLVREQRREAREQRRILEVQRCRLIWPNKGWQSACTNKKCGQQRVSPAMARTTPSYSKLQAELDNCTWGHADHDLPPHCRWGAECRNADRCRYNHM